jgi:putative thioredoxin
MDKRSLLNDSRARPILIEFLTPWCTICNTIMGEVDKFSTEISGKWKFLKIDASKNMPLAEEFDVYESPTFIIIKDGTVLDSFSGNCLSQVIDRIRSLS